MENTNAIPNVLSAYVDGSFDKETARFAYGVIMLDGDNTVAMMSAADDDPELASMHNVAGEIKGAEAAIRFCLEHGVKELTIFHDYEGIAKWCSGEWKANKAGTIAYKAFYDGTDVERKLKYRLAWSLAFFIEKGAPKVRFRPFENLKRDYIESLLETRDMRRATEAAFGSRDKLKNFISEWKKFWLRRGL